MSENYRDHDNKEFDVDTGTYMEDVHSNDLIGIDKDSDGLIDNVEELIEDADERAEKYNSEQESKRRERIEKENSEKPEDDKKKISFELVQ